jgi:chemotaxis protein MotA
MFSIIGLMIVFGAVIGGFPMEHGNLPALIRPAELLIVGGSAIGTLLVANRQNCPIGSLWKAH